MVGSTGQIQYLPPEAICRFLSAAKLDRHYAVFELAVTSGMRPSDYLALRWSDIDLHRGTASIVRSLDWKAIGGWEFAENKTGRSWRVVRLHASVLKALKEWKVLQDGDRELGGKRWTL